MKIFHIICTRNRAEQLSATLAKFNTVFLSAHQIVLVLANTPQVRANFAEKYRRTKIARAGKGLGYAGNAGIAAPSPKQAQGAKA